MEHWAGKFPNVQFLCVCVESAGVAQLFDRMIGFRNVINCYIPSRQYLPRGYGQLGCSGFIVSDAKGNFISRKSKAYLDYGEDAFLHVESLLTKELKAGSTMQQKEVAAPSCVTINDRRADVKTSVSVPSIGIVSMDDEHERCARALEGLLDQLSVQALTVAIAEIQTHFQHEENVLIEYKFGGSITDPFSALHSHIQDHKRILQIGSDELRDAKARSKAVQSACEDGSS
jgi:hemerythrin